MDVHHVPYGLILSGKDVTVDERLRQRVYAVRALCRAASEPPRRRRRRNSPIASRKRASTSLVRWEFLFREGADGSHRDAAGRDDGGDPVGVGPTTTRREVVVGALVAENPRCRSRENAVVGTKGAAAPRDFQELELLGPNRVEPRRFACTARGRAGRSGRGSGPAKALCV